LQPIFPRARNEESRQTLALAAGGKSVGENGYRKKLRRGWCWGAKDLREELLEMIGQKQGQQQYGAELKESEEQKAERLLGEILGAMGWRKEDLNHRTKGGMRKTRMATRLRSETVKRWKWIAKRLEMGQWRTGANAVRACQRTREKHTISHL
jgi:hypothetical protein